MGGRRAALAILVLAASLAPRGVYAQVVAEPALNLAAPASTETFQVYVAFPRNSFVVGGIIRFPVAKDVDIGGRAGLWAVDNADDTPFAGADLRYGLLARELTGSGMMNLSFDVGVGVSEPGPTVWKIPVGFIVGIGFGPGGETAEVFANPRLEFGISSGADETDSALFLDFGGFASITKRLGAMAALRFGNGLFQEGDKVVLGISALWRL